MIYKACCLRYSSLFTLGLAECNKLKRLSFLKSYTNSSLTTLCASKHPSCIIFATNIVIRCNISGALENIYNWLLSKFNIPILLKLVSRCNWSASEFAIPYCQFIYSNSVIFPIDFGASFNTVVIALIKSFIVNWSLP